MKMPSRGTMGRRNRQRRTSRELMTSKREFLKTAGAGDRVRGRRRHDRPRPTSCGRRAPIRWRLQTYAGAGAGRARHQALDRRLQQGGQRRDGDRALHRRPAGAAGRAVPRRADAARSTPPRATTIRWPRRSTSRCSRAYFPFASRYSLDVPALWNWYGLKEIWEEAYGEVGGVTWLSTGSWDPCNFATTGRSARSPTCRGCGSTPSRPAAASCRASASCR